MSDPGQDTSPFDPVEFAQTFTSFPYGEGQRLVCPRCGHEMNHLVAAHINRGGKLLRVLADEPPEIVDSVPVDRGSSIWLQFWCEGCQRYWLRHFHFHKGQVYVADQLSEGDPDESPRTMWRD